MANHTHLDRQVRDRGSGCPACDLFWAEQDARLSGTSRANVADRQIEQMVRPRPITKRVWCNAMYDTASAAGRSIETHTCNRRFGHEGNHFCECCGREWK